MTKQMNLQEFFNITLPLVFVAIGWFLKELWSAVQSLKIEVHDIRTHLAENYMHKDDFSDRWDEVLKAVHRIEDKLDRITEK